MEERPHSEDRRHALTWKNVLPDAASATNMTMLNAGPTATTPKREEEERGERVRERRRRERREGMKEEEGVMKGSKQESREKGKSRER